MTNSTTPSDLGPDLANYRPMIADMKLSDQEADALLGTLFNIMRRFVELGLQISVPDIFESLSTEFSAASPSSTTLFSEEGDQ